MKNQHVEQAEASAQRGAPTKATITVPSSKAINNLDRAARGHGHEPSDHRIGSAHDPHGGLRIESENPQTDRRRIRVDENGGSFRKTRFKGIGPTQLWAYFVRAACNLVRTAALALGHQPWPRPIGARRRSVLRSVKATAKAVHLAAKCSDLSSAQVRLICSMPHWNEKITEPSSALTPI